MCTSLRRDQRSLSSVPPDVLDALTRSRPEKVRERAWLVIYYSIALGCLDEMTSIVYAEKMKSNLWLAFSDVKFLLKPSFLHIEALIAMTFGAERYMSPDACWTLTSKACTMLIALGVGKSPNMYT